MPDLVETINGLIDAKIFFQARGDMAVGDAKLLLYSWHKAIEDAVELLEAHLPRVLTLEEARAALKSEPVIWIEEKDGDTQAAIRKKHYYETQTDEVIDFTDLDVSPACDVYGKEYRMWTARPTEEQRKGVPWE